MSLRQDCIDLIDELGPSSSEDLVRYMPGYTVEQIGHALSQAKYDGKLLIVEKSRGKGTGLGRTCAKFGLSEPKKPVAPPVAGPRPVSSVWELGQRAASASTLNDWLRAAL